MITRQEDHDPLVPEPLGVDMSGTKPNPGTPKDGRMKGRGAKPGPKMGSKNKKRS